MLPHFNSSPSCLHHVLAHPPWTAFHCISTLYVIKIVMCRPTAVLWGTIRRHTYIHKCILTRLYHREILLWSQTILGSTPRISLYDKSGRKQGSSIRTIWVCRWRRRRTMSSWGPLPFPRGRNWSYLLSTCTRTSPLSPGDKKQRPSLIAIVISNFCGAIV